MLSSRERIYVNKLNGVASHCCAGDGQSGRVSDIALASWPRSCRFQTVDVARRSWDAQRRGTVFIWCRFVLRVPDVLGVTIDYINFPIVTLSAEMSTCGNETLQHSA